MVVAIIGTLAAIAIPMSNNSVRYIKVSGDARDIANAIAVTKMRAAAQFTQARLYFDISGKQYYIQTYNKTATPAPKFETQGGATSLASTVSFGYGAMTNAPLNTQTTLGQAVACMTDPVPPATPVAVANTACIIFNSRGLPDQRHRHGRPDQRRRDLRDRWGTSVLVSPSRRPGSSDVAGQHLRHAAMDAEMIERQAGGERGTTILEVVVASAILVTLMAGLTNVLAALAISTTEKTRAISPRAPPSTRRTRWSSSWR